MALVKIKKSFNQSTIEWRIFLFVFAYVIVAGLMLQKIVLPMTPWHAGQGLMAGGDWVVFQKIALAHTAQVRELGWGALELNPPGNAPAGLAAFAYLVTGVSEPWVLLPVHGVVYALAAVAFFWILKAVGASTHLAIHALLPLVLMPSLAMVWGQLHKDVWAIAAVLLILAYWSRLFVAQHLGTGIALLVLGFANASLWWMRPYTLQMVLVGQLVLFIFLLLTWLKNKNHSSLLFGVLALAVTFGALKSPQGMSAVADEPAKTCKVWVNSLPVAFVDNKLMSLACTRDYFMEHLSTAKSNVDLDVTFASAVDVAAYAPRALQVGVLAPFPYMWFSEGTSKASSIFRAVAAFEMCVMYVALLGLCILFILMMKNKSGLNFEQKMAIGALMLFALVWVEIYALVSGNVGSIYRVRFPIMLLWMGLGLLGWYRAWEWWRARTLMQHV
jgi:hypothetical protein